ncbi:MAG: hypothetical protein ACRDQ4_08945 [Pseudonocardiaceae bacterium]
MDTSGTPTDPVQEIRGVDGVLGRTRRMAWLCEQLAQAPPIGTARLDLIRPLLGTGEVAR